MTADRCPLCGDPHAGPEDAEKHDTQFPTSDCPHGCWCESLCWARQYRTTCWQQPVPA